MKNIDVIIILGQGVNPDGTVPEHVQHEIANAIQMCESQNIPAIIFSGKYSGFVKQTISMTEARAMYNYAQSLHSKNILLLTEEQSQDTIGNIIFSKVILDEHGWKNSLIISHPQHIIRVQFIAERVFGEGYSILYRGHQSITTARSFRHTRYFNFLALIYTRWILRRTWPNDNEKMINWLMQHHFLYNGSWLKGLVAGLPAFNK